MSELIKEFFGRIFKSRLIVLAAVMVVLTILILHRLFYLQIVRGESYQENYTLKIKKERVLDSTRGNIYDRNGNLLAYNKLAYTVRIEDNGSYDTTAEKNEKLNAELAEMIGVLHQNGDKIQNDFGIAKQGDTYVFTQEGASRKRFLADVYGKSSVDDLVYDRKLGYDPSTAEANQVIDYLAGKSRFSVDSELYDPQTLYEIVVLRYAMSRNSYQKYILTDIATDVSDKTLAYVSENGYRLQGVTVESSTIRKYAESKYFSHIIGYTGKIDEAEYEKYSQENDQYALTDTVGKAGIEQVMDSYLKGEKGYELLYVDNLGKVSETIETKEPVAGDDLYLSIDMDLQKAVYDLLEQEIAGIVYSKIANIREYNAGSGGSASDIMIPIYDVYYALINNNVLDIDHYAAADASTNEKEIEQAFLQKKQTALDEIERALLADNPAPFNQLDEELRDYLNYVVTMLQNQNILLTDEIDKTDEVFLAWRAREISLEEYLKYAIEKNWIDITQFDLNEKYSDSTEIYDNLVRYIIDTLNTDHTFAKKVYKYVIDQDMISPVTLCLTLYDQEVLPLGDPDYAMLSGGQMSSFEFLRTKVKNLEITPAQLALDPCSGSCVITNPQNGELLALVSYPGYDNNRLANNLDAAYYQLLQDDKSLPLYNHATQEETAPGSTFKMVTATAGLTEGVIDPEEIIEDKGVYENVANGPACWIWNSFHTTHGKINVSEAIRDSCNYFFYEVGYRLANGYVTFRDELGISRIAKYAEEYGLGNKTGIEIPESEPHIATEYPVTAAIGQSDNNYATVHLGRYIMALANRGTVYDLTLLGKLYDPDGNEIETYSPKIRNRMDNISDTTWSAIQRGNAMVVEESDAFVDFPITVAGKTGTAQQIATRPNHALFVCYAPYDGSGATVPKVSIATRIAYGYSSANAAEVTSRILRYYFGFSDEEELLSGQAETITTTNTVTD